VPLKSDVMCFSTSILMPNIFIRILSVLIFIYIQNYNLKPFCTPHFYPYFINLSHFIYDVDFERDEISILCARMVFWGHLIRKMSDYGLLTKPTLVTWKICVSYLLCKTVFLYNSVNHWLITGSGCCISL